MTPRHAFRRTAAATAAAPSTSRTQLPRLCLFCRHTPLSHPPTPKRTFTTTPHHPFPATTTTTITEPNTKETIAPQTHYDFFPTTLPTGPPPTGPFAINLAHLKREFLQLQATAHPDRHPPHQKARAEALSARINDAYRTLADPLRRAQYLLAQRGLDVAEDETATVEDPGLLMAVLEAREEIEEAGSEAELEGVRGRNERSVEESVRRIDEAFGRDDLVTAKEEAVKLRYWTNIKESIDAWEPGKPVVLIH